jgi:hypothetical protein
VQPLDLCHPVQGRIHACEPERAPVQVDADDPVGVPRRKQRERTRTGAHVQRHLYRGAHGEPCQQARPAADPEHVLGPDALRAVGRDQQPIERLESDTRTHDAVSNGEEIGEVARCKRGERGGDETGLDLLAAEEEARLNEERLLGVRAKRQSGQALREPEGAAVKDCSA